MKQILLAILAATTMAACVAQPYPYQRDDERHWRGPRHEPAYIPDRFERKEMWRHGRKIVIEERYRCTDQRGRRCMAWTLVSDNRR